MSDENDLIADFEQEDTDQGRSRYLKAIGGYSDAWRNGDFEKAVAYAAEMLDISQADPALKEFRQQAGDYLQAARDAVEKAAGT